MIYAIAAEGLALNPLRASSLAGISMVMAELVRQAESACAESGHVLAATWNLHLGLADTMTGAAAALAAYLNVLSMHSTLWLNNVHSVTNQ